MRLFPSKETLLPTRVTVKKLLNQVWSNYEKQKPVNANTLATKFSLSDLLRVAQKDQEIAKLLLTIGLYKNPVKAYSNKN